MNVLKNIVEEIKESITYHNMDKPTRIEILKDKKSGKYGWHVDYTYYDEQAYRDAIDEAIKYLQNVRDGGAVE